MTSGSVAQWLFDRVAAGLGLLALSPIFAICAVAVWLSDGLPIFFRQSRVGRNGRLFWLLKFRSMRTGTSGSQITAGGDRRITRVGAILRKYKLDELPQLVNVLVGDMSLIGPRPEVPRFVNLEDPVWQAVLAVRPGISDLATLVYRDEEEMLASASDPEQYYRERILPEKLGLNLRYLGVRTFWQDLLLILLTLRYAFVRAGYDPQRILQRFC